MPRLRWTQTKSEELQQQKMAERLAAAGADLDLSIVTPVGVPSIKITQVPELLANNAQAFPWGTLYVFELRIVVLAPKLRIQNFDLSSLEWDLNAWFLVDPKVNHSTDEFYRYPGGGTVHRSGVLNHRLQAERTRRRGDPLEGTVLAQSFEPIPNHYAQGSLMRVCFTVVDQFDYPNELTIDLHVDRTAEQARPRQLRRTSLYDDWIGVPKRSDGARATCPGKSANLESREVEAKQLPRGKSLPPPLNVN